MANDHFYADGIAAVQLSHGNLRIHLVQQGSEDGQTIPAGTLIVPAARAQTILATLNQSVGRIIKSCASAARPPRPKPVARRRPKVRAATPSP